MGLVTSLHPMESLEEEVDKLTATLSEKSPIGLRLGKEAFVIAEEFPFEKAVLALAEALTRVIDTKDAAEGISAFKEKRKPRFTGT